jgi:hypothetical protein
VGWHPHPTGVVSGCLRGFSHRRQLARWVDVDSRTGPPRVCESATRCAEPRVRGGWRVHLAAHGWCERALRRSTASAEVWWKGHGRRVCRVGPAALVAPLRTTRGGGVTRTAAVSAMVLGARIGGREQRGTTTGGRTVCPVELSRHPPLARNVREIVRPSVVMVVHGERVGWPNGINHQRRDPPHLYTKPPRRC